MIIFSFDCAIKNLGFCCIEIDEKWREKTSNIIQTLHKLYEDIKDMTKSEFLQKTQTIIKSIDKLLSNMFKLHFANIIDLIPEKKVESVKFSTILRNLKYTIECLNKQLPTPDIVLIETQMAVNDKARGVSRYIEDIYTSVEEPEDSITFAIASFPIIPVEITNSKSTKVFYINPVLKNKYSVDLSYKGDYSSFIEKLSNYTANKNHTTYNFKFYMNKTGKGELLKNIPNKLDDVSDAFMMAYAWLCHNKYIDSEFGLPL